MTLTPGEIVGAITSTISVASILAALLPQGAPGSFWAAVRVVIDTLAQNYGNAANEKK